MPLKWFHLDILSNLKHLLNNMIQQRKLSMKSNQLKVDMFLQRKVLSLLLYNMNLLDTMYNYSMQ